jgi:serine/threonine protein kinase
MREVSNGSEALVSMNSSALIHWLPITSTCTQIAHRDIKPDNILINNKEQPVYSEEKAQL